MLDLSPEKLMVLLAVGLMVLGPQKLPSAARTMGRGLARARQLAATVTDPIRESVAEPTRIVNEALNQAVNDIRPGERVPASTAGTPASPVPGDPTRN
jgi:sec-independent protein translocase protein TatB